MARAPVPVAASHSAGRATSVAERDRAQAGRQLGGLGPAGGEEERREQGGREEGSEASIHGSHSNRASRLALFAILRCNFMSLRHFSPGASGGIAAASNRIRISARISPPGVDTGPAPCSTPRMRKSASIRLGLLLAVSALLLACETGEAPGEALRGRDGRFVDEALCANGEAGARPRRGRRLGGDRRVGPAGRGNPSGARRLPLHLDPLRHVRRDGDATRPATSAPGPAERPRRAPPPRAR